MEVLLSPSASSLLASNTVAIFCVGPSHPFGLVGSSPAHVVSSFFVGERLTLWLGEGGLGVLWAMPPSLKQV